MTDFKEACREILEEAYPDDGPHGGISSAILAAHNAAIVEALEYNSAFIGDDGHRKEGFVHKQLIQEAIARYQEGKGE